MTIKWIPDNQIGEVQKDGTFTRAASYGVSMINAYFYDELSRYDAKQYADEMQKIIVTEEKLVPSLKALDIIGFFTPEEWLQTNHQGRLMIALIYLDQNPNEVSEQIIKHLNDNYDSYTPQLQKMVDQIK